MSRLFPHPPYAEDQPLSHIILHTHVALRSLTTFTLLSLISSPSIYLFKHRAITAAPASPPRPSHISLTGRTSLSSYVLRNSGRAALLGLLLGPVMTEARMWGMEEVEWQDRAWRLGANPGQVQCDDWTWAGILGGGFWGFLGGRSGSDAVRTSFKGEGGLGKTPLEAGRGMRILAGTGTGSEVGMLGYLGWRYSIRGGSVEEKDL